MGRYERRKELRDTGNKENIKESKKGKENGITEKKEEVKKR